MNATDFIKQMMDKMSSSVGGISIKYAFEKSTGFHIVEVSPDLVRAGNETYKKIAHQFRIDFHKEFPMEDIIISKVNDFHDMTNIIYEVSNTSIKSSGSYSFSTYHYEYDDVYLPLAA